MPASKGIHLSRDTLQAEPVGAVREPPLRGFPGSAGILPAVDWRRCPEAGEDAGAPRVGLSRLKLVAVFHGTNLSIRRLFPKNSGRDLPLTRPSVYPLSITARRLEV